MIKTKQELLNHFRDINAMYNNPFMYQTLNNMIDELLEQEPKTGHWIEIAQYSDGKHKIECSECGNHIFDRGHANSFNVKNKYKFCPNCGAKMTYVPDIHDGKMSESEE